MTISVVIPAFNQADLLPYTLDAVLAQTRRSAEIIVVDGGSSDDTGEVLKAYEPQIRAIYIPNSGELASRNTGLRAASGHFVAFCDAGDLWRPDYLETMMKMWSAEPALHAVFCNSVAIQDGEWQAATKFDGAPHGFWRLLRPLGRDMAVFEMAVVKDLLCYQPFVPSAMIVDRNWFLKSGGWDESVSRIANCGLATVLRVGADPPIGVCYKPLVGVRMHEGNVQADEQKVNLGDSMVLETVLTCSGIAADYEPLVRKSITERRRAALAVAFSRGDLPAVRAIYALLPALARTPDVRLKRAIACLSWPFCRLDAEIMRRLELMKRILTNAFINPFRVVWR